MKKFLSVITMLVFCLITSYTEGWDNYITLGMSIPITNVEFEYDNTPVNDDADSIGVGFQLFGRNVNPNGLAFMYGFDIAYNNLSLKSSDLELNFTGIDFAAELGIGGSFINNDSCLIIGSAIFGVNTFDVIGTYRNLDISTLGCEFFLGIDLYIQKNLENGLGIFIDTSVAYNFVGSGGAIIENKTTAFKETFKYDNIKGFIILPRLGISKKL